MSDSKPQSVSQACQVNKFDKLDNFDSNPGMYTRSDELKNWDDQKSWDEKNWDEITFQPSPHPPEEGKTRIGTWNYSQKPLIERSYYVCNTKFYGNGENKE
jgi:hypothetical protein